MSVLGEAVIEIGADGSGFRRQLERELRKARVGKVGEDAGGVFGQGFDDGVGRSLGGGGLRKTFFKIGAWATGLLSLVAPIGPALVGIVAGLSALIGAVGLASGSLVTLTAAVSSLGLAAVTTKVAFSGLGDAIKVQAQAQQELAETGAVSAATQEKLDAAMKKLAPSARAVVKEITAQRGAWGELRKTIQQNFFSGVAGDIKSVSKTLLPVLNKSLGDTATLLNGAVHGFANWVNSAAGIATITSILDGMNAALKSILPGLGAIGRGLMSLWAGSLPQAEKMSNTFLDLGLRFEAWASRINESGKLSGFLADASSAASSLLGAIGSLGGLLGTVFGAGADEGVSMLDTFSQATDRLNEFFKTAEGSSALDSFYDTIQATAETAAALGATLGPVFSGLGSVLDAVSPSIDAFRNAFLPVVSSLAEQVGSALKEISPQISRIGALFQKLLPYLMPVLKFFGSTFISVVKTGVGGVLDIIEGVLNAIMGAIKVFKGLFTGDWSLLWEGVKQVVGGAVQAIIGAITAFFAGMLSKFSTVRTLLLTAVVALWTGVKIAFSAAITFVRVLWDGFWNGLSTIVTTVFAAISAIISGAWSVITTIFTGAVNVVRSVVGSAWNWLRSTTSSALGAVVGVVVSVASRIGGAFKAVWDGVQKWVGKAWGYIQDIPGKIKGAFSNIWHGIGNGLKDAINNILHLPLKIPKVSIPGVGSVGGQTLLNRLATGAVSAPGGMALVGERGPELVDMPRGSRVYPAHTTERILSDNSGGPIDLSPDTLQRLAELVARMILVGAGQVVSRNNLQQGQAVFS